MRVISSKLGALGPKSDLFEEALAAENDPKEGAFLAPSPTGVVGVLRPGKLKDLGFVVEVTVGGVAAAGSDEGVDVADEALCDSRSGSLFAAQNTDSMMPHSPPF